MRVVLDTKILVSSLLVQMGHPAAIYRAWHEGHFTLLACVEQPDELRATLHKPALAARLRPYQAGRLVNEVKELAEIIGPLPRVERSQAGKADYLVTGDKRELARDFRRPVRIQLAVSFRDTLLLFHQDLKLMEELLLVLEVPVH